MSGRPGIDGRVLRLLDEIGDLPLVVDMHDAEARRLHARHLEAADRDVGARVDMLLKHDLVVHLVDVVAGEDDDVARRVVLDDVDVLVDRVGRAGVPLVLGDALAGRQDVEALVASGPQEVPAVLQVPDQAVRLVLRGDADAPDAGIDRVRQGEVDDPRLAAEEHGGLGPAVGQLQQPAAASTRQHVGHGVACEWRDPSRLSHAVLPQSAGSGRHRSLGPVVAGFREIVAPPPLTGKLAHVLPASIPGEPIVRPRRIRRGGQPAAADAPGPACQMSRAYSRIERSEENQPMRAVLWIAFSCQSACSAHSASRPRWVSQ